MTDAVPTIPDAEPSAKQQATWLLIACVAVFVGYCLFASSSSLWDRDEPRFSRAAVEMVEGGDYLVPHFNTDLRLHKPSGVYWAMAAAVKVIGKTELAFRLPSVVGMLLCSVMTYLIGRRMFGVRAARWAFIALATSTLPIVMGTLATADGLLNGLLAVALWVVVEAVYGKARLPHFVLFALATGGAWLVKGPVGAFPLISLAGMLLWGRREVRLGVRTWVGLGIATLVGLGIFLAWAIPANEATDGKFFSIGVGEHVVERGAAAREGHGGSGFGGYLLTLPLYLPVLIVGTFPWVMHLPGAVRALAGKRLGSAKERAVLWGGTAPIFLVFSFYATKLPHYILPIFPIIAVGIGATIVAHARGSLGEGDRHSLRGGGWWFAPVALAAAGSIAAVPVIIDSWWAMAGVGPFAVAMLIATALAVWAQSREAVTRASLALVVFVVITAAAAGIGLFPSVETAFRPSPRLARIIHEHAQPGPITWLGYHEPSFVFYVDLPYDQAVTSLDAKADLADFISAGKGAALVTPEHLERYRTIYREQTGKELTEQANVMGVELFDGDSPTRRTSLIVIVPDNGGAAVD